MTLWVLGLVGLLQTADPSSLATAITGFIVFGAIGGLPAAGGMVRPGSAVDATDPTDTTEGDDLWICCERGSG